MDELANPTPLADLNTSTNPRTKTIMFVTVLVLGFAARLAVATLGFNYDIYSWKIVADLMAHGQNIYANTERYNYGPVWAYILYAIQFIKLKTGIQSMTGFHLLIAAFLSLADVAIALLLRSRFGLFPALFFFLNPVMILLTGFHSQIDSFALLFGFAGWLIYERSLARNSLLLSLASALLVGLSLSTKHILIFFPFWVLFSPRLGTRLQRFCFALLAYAVFVVSFLPMASSPAAKHGILVNVLEYHSLFGGLMLHVIGVLIPLAPISEKFVQYTGIDPMFELFKLLFIAIMIVMGRWAALRRPSEIFPLYLICFLLFATAVVNQYFAIPMIACAIYYRNWASWVYSLVTTLVLLVSQNNLALHYWSLANFSFAFNTDQAQFWLIFVLLGCEGNRALLRQVRRAFHVFIHGDEGSTVPKTNAQHSTLNAQR